jgi:hypothetical protein
MFAFATVFLASCLHPPATAGRSASDIAIYTGVSPTGYIPPDSIVEILTTQDISADSENGSATYSAELTRDIVGGNGTSWRRPALPRASWC